jgi:SAM-dependent methyltransferase
MFLEFLTVLACPGCKRELRCDAAAKSSDDEVMEGVLQCAGCARIYPITGGIPRFVSHEDYAGSFGLQWNRFKTEQLDSVNGTSLSRTRFRNETGWEEDSMPGEWVLDAGCGAGRFLESAARSGANVIAVDLSRAVDAARSNLGSRRQIHFAQASIYELPFREKSLGASYSLGVIQHTPDPLQAVTAVAATVKPAGKLALTIYEKKRFTWLNGKYLVRPLTRRLPPRLLLLLLKFSLPLLFPLTEVLFRIPLLGRIFRFVIPVANYVDIPDLTLRQRYRWALMDTFDMLAPRYDSPQTKAEVSERLSRSGFVNIDRGQGSGLNLIARRAAQFAQESN